MSEKEFLELVDKSKYQVFFFCSRVSLPFSFIYHTWVVTSDHGEVHRYDVWHWTNRSKISIGHLHIDLYQPWLGVRMFFSKDADPKALRFKGILLHKLEGEAGSTAERMVCFLRDKSETYPFINKYHFFPGPNSNTFTEWVIDQFPELKFKLPWSAIGKNY